MSASQDPVESSDDDKKKVDVDEYDLAKRFKAQFHISTEECVSLQESYVLQLAASKSWDTIAAGATPRDVHVFSLSDNGLTRRPLGNELQTASNKAAVCGVRFANNDPNLLYVGTTDGTIFTFDLRTHAPVSKFEESSDGDRPKKSLTCFDLNANDRVLCAGTEQSGPDTYLLFFDTRQQKTMGGYWESHSEDISQVRFHPSQPDTLATGSKDGLINVFDISQDNEDDAFKQCMNTESSVKKLQWHQANGDDGKTERDLLSCITHVNELKLYDVADSEQTFAGDRDAMNRHFGRASGRDCNMVGVHSTNQPGKLLVVAGSIYNSEQNLRSLTVQSSTKQPQKVTVKPAANFSSNRQVVRCSLYNENTQMLITGGESGLITLWAPGAASEKVKVELKEKTKDRHRKHKAKPY